MTTIKNVLLLSSIYLLAVSCGKSQGNDRLTEKAYIEGKAGLQGQTEAQQLKAEELEADLEYRYRIIEALTGTFEGSVSTERGTYNVRVLTSSSLPKIKLIRKRLPEEVLNDLNKLSMNTQIIMWREGMPQGAIGCLSTGNIPNLKKISYTVASDQCPGLYFFEGAVDKNSASLTSEELSSAVTEGKITKVDNIKLKIQPTSNAQQLNLVLTRAAE